MSIDEEKKKQFTFVPPAIETATTEFIYNKDWDVIVTYVTEAFGGPTTTKAFQHIIYTLRTKHRSDATIWAACNGYYELLNTFNLTTANSIYTVQGAIKARNAKLAQQIKHEDDTVAIGSSIRSKRRGKRGGKKTGSQPSGGGAGHGASRKKGGGSKKGGRH
jgi:hypothetical protein